MIMGLLQYENKMSVVNFAIKRHATAEDLIVPNKQELVFVTPLRRYASTNGMHHGLSRNDRDAFNMHY